MNCQEFRAYLDAYLDGELEAQRTLDADAHLAFCMPCQWILAKEREFRQLLCSRAKRDVAPPSLQARLHSALDRADRRELRRRFTRWMSVPAAAAAIALLWLSGVWGPAERPLTDSSLVTALAGKHLTYSQMEAPAEIATADRQMVAGWFKERVRFDVPVPDFTPSGIRLVGGRISDLGERQVAYLLYEKGRSLVSLFVFPSRGLALPATGWEEIGAKRYFFTEFKGNQVVMWTQDETTFALVSQLSREALVECAEAVWLMMTGDKPTT